MSNYEILTAVEAVRRGEAELPALCASLAIQGVPSSYFRQLLEAQRPKRTVLRLAFAVVRLVFEATAAWAVR